ncbi:MAG TPA: hypothetical protein VG013_37105 [Gemmataceae bacterium]|nr:hypothetical protein [Gemmataceae bacterium]
MSQAEGLIPEEADSPVAPAQGRRAVRPVQQAVTVGVVHGPVYQLAMIPKASSAAETASTASLARRLGSGR